MFKQALEQASAWVGSVPGVIMVGQGRADDGSPTIDVWVDRSVSLPQSVLGVPVRVRDTGPIEAQ